MRQLRPVSKLETIQPVTITNEQYEELLHLIDELKLADDVNNKSLNDLIENLSNIITTKQVSTDNINALTGSIKQLTSDDISTDKLTGSLAELDRVIASFVRTNKLNTDEIVTSDIQAETAEIKQITSDDITSESLTADVINAHDVNIDNLNIENFHSSKIDSNEIITDVVSTDELSGNSAEVYELTSDKAEIREIVSDEQFADVIRNRFLLHDAEFNRQDLENYDLNADGEWYCVLPKFVNGSYFLIAREGETGPFLWCMEITNDTKNIGFTWSINSKNQYLIDIEILEDSNDEIQVIQIHGNLRGTKQVIYYRSDNLETIEPPQWYGTKQFDGQKQFTFNTAAGRWLPNSTFIEELHAESMLIDDVEFETVTITRNLQLPSSYDQYGNPEGFTRGETNQYIRDVENEQGARGLQWTTPSEYPDEEDETLITSRGVANYDGKTEQENYPIKHLNEDTTVHGDLTVEDTTTTDNLNVDTNATLPHIVGLNGTSDLNIQEGFLADDTGLWYKTTESVDGVVTAVKYPIAHLDRNVDWSTVSIGSVLGFDKQTKSITPIKSISLDTVNVAEELIVEGLTFLHDDVSIGASLTIRGDLIVDGTTYTTEEESLDTSSDFIVLRKNNKSGLALNEKSGIVVHNYASGKSASIGVDKDGIWRVADNAEEHTTTFNNISQFNGDWYEGIEEDNSITIPHGAITSQDADELSEVVWYNNKYYKWDTVHWFEVSLVDSTLYIDIDDPITDEDLITELEKLDQYDLFYYRSMAVLSISDEFNEPLLTRDEEENLNPHAVLIWDEDKQRAISITTPQTNNTVLTAQITAAQTETTDGYLIGDVAYNSDLTETTIPDGYSEDSRTLIGQIIIFNDLFYTAVTTPAENPEDPDVTTYYEVRGLSETGFTDTEEVIVQRLIDELSELDGNDVYYVNYYKTTSGSIDYAWKSGGSGSVARFSTYAEYEEALSIPEGQDGYIANNALVVIDEETDYVKVVL